jgi:hypothetical protein
MATDFAGSGARFVTALILTVILAGCGPHGSTGIADPGKVSEIHKGSSTKADIQALFGTPQGTEYAANGDETWNYHYRAAVVGITAEVFGVEPFKSVSVTFGKDGIVKAYGISGSVS